MTFGLSCFSKRSKLNHRKTWTQPSVILLVVDRDAGSNQAFYNGDVVSLMYFVFGNIEIDIPSISIGFVKMHVIQYMKHICFLSEKIYVFFSENISIS